jgi:hypothetical protein
MSSIALQFLTSLAGPVISLKQMIQEHQKKREEKGRLKEDLANSLQAEIKEFEVIIDDIDNLGKGILPILKSVDGQPTLGQLMQLIDCCSQIPRILAKLIISFIHQARACKDISKQKGFMNSLLATNRFMHDFIERMGETYIGKDTVKIDSSFFRFLLMYKREILKGSKIDKINKKEIESLKKQAEIILRGLNQPFLKRHMRKEPIRKWKASLTQFNKVFKDMKIDAEGMDVSGLNDFMPSGLREVAPFLDKSPPI